MNFLYARMLVNVIKAAMHVCVADIEVEKNNFLDTN